MWKGSLINGKDLYVNDVKVVSENFIKHRKRYLGSAFYCLSFQGAFDKADKLNCDTKRRTLDYQNLIIKWFILKWTFTKFLILIKIL